ncbi:hypothetical protein [Virgibacillus halodenitrificans]|uniref:hypothetical protein n=1 Tax=Virgibacillus halodenitrificans TaxID=1482 RepID=UPI000EF4A21C|nr:hypothetical protein [Virgibacillus halodenitrificans]
MGFIETRKLHTKWSIEQNPTTILINRTEKKRVGGGFDEVKSTAGPFDVRIFSKSTKTNREVSTLAGKKSVNVTWSMLADANADIKSGTNVKDEFTAVGLGKFLVITVRPQMVKEVVVGYQVDLERVS